MLPYKFMSAFGSTVGVYRGCCWVIAADPAMRGLDGDIAAVLPAAGLPESNATIGFAVEACAAVPDVPDVPAMLFSV